MKLFPLFYRRKRLIFSVILFSLCFTVICTYIYLNYADSVKRNNIIEIKKCFLPTICDKNDGNNITLLDDILESKKKPTPDRSVFFIESSCKRNRLATLTAR